jgi:serine/threonine protein kinase/nucleotide-binding universal stress UspA family protein
MKRMTPGTELDGFRIGECLHAGGMAHVYAVEFAQTAHAPFPMVMKVPRMTAGDGAENIVGFEVEHQIMQTLQGRYVPRFVAAGDLAAMPYLVMEHISGLSLQQWLDEHQEAGTRPQPQDIARMGKAMAMAVHSLHKQNVCHLDLKPANVLLPPDGRAVLLDFGLSCHSQLPDLLAEELRKAVGSPAWIAPEQVVGVRGDPRSDLFALGVILYEMATGELPFGNPQTQGGLRQRLWMEPTPLRRLRPDLPEWLQEIVLRCLQPQAQDRYPSAAHLAFDLHHPEQVKITDRGRQLQGRSVWQHLRRWVQAAGMQYQPSPLPAQQQVERVPIVMAAVPHNDVTDAALFSMRQEVARALGHLPGARLAVVTVVSGSATSAANSELSETSVHRHHLTRLQQWAQPLDLAHHQASYHVLESGDVAQALLRYAEGNHVSMIIMGAATHGLQMQRLVATVPIKVAMNAPCTVMLVKADLPFEHLAGSAA